MSEYSQGIMGDGPVILKDGEPLTPDQIVEELNQLWAMAKAGSELAGYTSYAEIVGGVNHNRAEIRKACDEVFHQGRVFNELEVDRIISEEEPQVPEPFVREMRYVIFKIKDIEKYLTQHEHLTLGIISRQVNAGRKLDGKMPLECVVIESDWPEYESTWKALESRMNQEAKAHA